MVKKPSDTSRGMEPPKIDNLKLINGIGPAVERRLHGIGIYTYAQLAALSPADIAAAVADLAGLSAERITKQGWIGQARRLASESTSSEAQEGVEAPAQPVAPPVASQVELDAPVAEKTESPPPVVAPQSAKETQITPPVVAMTGVPRLRQIETVPAGTHTPQNFLLHDQPFDVHLTLDLSDLRVPHDTQFSYKASIYGKSLEGYPRQRIGDASGSITSTDSVTIEVHGMELPKGNYRLLTVVKLSPTTMEPGSRTELLASKEGGLLLIS